MNLVNKVLRRIQKARMIGSLRDANPPMLRRIGTQSAGWTLPAFDIRPGMTAVCVGAGEDISFDVELNKMGLMVFTLDPTPRAKKHVQQVLEGAQLGGAVAVNHSTRNYDLSGFDQSRFTFVEAGLWNQDRPMQFFAPRNPRHVSHSIVNLQGTEECFEAQCMRLQTFCASFNIGPPDILKLDIEGAEYAVLNDLAAGGLRPKILCVDFDEGNAPLDRDYMQRIACAIKDLKKLGYKFWHADGWGFSFALAQ